MNNASAEFFLSLVFADGLQTYAGVAFWEFGSFLAGAKVLLPVSK